MSLLCSFLTSIIMPPDEAWDGALEQPRPEKSIIVRNDDGTWKPPSNHSDSPNEEAWDGALESMVVDNDDDDGIWQPPSNHSDSPNEEAWDGELEQPPEKSIIVSNDDGDDDGTWQPSSNHSGSPHDNEKSRDYKRHRLQDNNGAENSKTKKKKKAKSTEAEDMNWVCAECKEAECLMDDPNAHVLVYCDGDCHRVFHLPCAGLSQVPCEDEDWICKDCTKSCHQCPFCKEYGQDNVDVFACRKDECGRFFHKSCLASNNVSFKMVEEQAFSTGSVSPRSVEEDVISTTCVVPSFVCPAHHCWTCTQDDALEKEQKEDEAKEKRGKKKQTSIYQSRKGCRLHCCLSCPSAYHAKCLPPTSAFNELAVLCPEHSMTQKLPDLDPSTSLQGKVQDKLARRYQRIFGQRSFHRQLPSGPLGVGRGGSIAFANHVSFCVPADIKAAVYSRTAGNTRSKKAKLGVPQKEREPPSKKSRVGKKSLSRRLGAETPGKRSRAQATPKAKAKGRSVPQKNRKPSAKKGLVVKKSLKYFTDKDGRRSRPLPAGKPAKKRSCAKATPKAKAKVKSVLQKDRPAKKSRMVKKSLKDCPLGAGRPARGFHAKPTPNARVSPNQEMAQHPMVERIVATIQTYDANTETWSSRDKLFSAPKKSSEGAGKCLEKKLHRGGTIKIYPSMLSETELTHVSEDLLSDEGAGFFRQYKIHADDEPRCHFLMHKHATEDFEDPQPGYAYLGKRIKMKSVPLANFDGVAEVSERMAETCGVAEWTTGVHAVLYRDFKDKMGFHADDDQGEQLILAAIIQMPTRQIRVVRIRPRPGVELQHGDEDIELFLEAGDGYSMDGEMQKHYVHGVADAPRPKRRVLTTPAAEPQTPNPTRSSDAAAITPSPIAMENSFIGAAVGGTETQRPMPCASEAEDDRRLVLVFRKGEMVVFENDTGVACDTLAPRKGRDHQFGQIPGLDEGKLYTRYEMLTLNGHIMAQRGISGNRDFGCDAMVVSGKRPDKLGHDKLFNLRYFVEQSKGALGVVKSCDLHEPIRVFRPTHYNHELQATGTHPKEIASKTYYRYDGLYFVTDKKEPEETTGPWEFQLERASCCNQIPNDSYIGHCLLMGTMNPEAIVYQPTRPEPDDVTSYEVSK